MKALHAALALLALLIFAGSCSIDMKFSVDRKNIDETAREAENRTIEVADSLAAMAGGAVGDDQRRQLEAAILAADSRSEETADLLAETQSSDPAVYIMDIESPEDDIDAAARCLPGETFWSLLAKAKPDEKYYGVGDCRNVYNPGYPGPLPPDFPGCPPPEEPFKPKTNEAYVWGLTKCGKNLFFGTGPNIHCLVLQGVGFTDPIETGSFVCEGNADPGCSSCKGRMFCTDWRPPSLYMYGFRPAPGGTVSVQCVEPAGLVDIGAAMPKYAQAIRTLTLGVRSAGAHKGVVFLAGPAIPVPGRIPAINMFAFDGATGDFIAAKSLPGHDNIRKWAVIKDVLYAGVGSPADLGGGKVLRWAGGWDGATKPMDPSLNAAAIAGLFDFVVVGQQLDGDVAELCEHEGRIFCTTWPMIESQKPITEAGLWMSPKLDHALAAAEAADGWEKVWSASDYEPDAVTAATYGGGALASYKGWLYWGTMHITPAAMIAHLARYPSEDPAAIVKALIGTWRAVSVFRGRNFEDTRWGKELDKLYGRRIDPRPNPDGTPKSAGAPLPRWGKRPDPRCGRRIELLYGERFLPVFVEGKGWRLRPNRMAVQGSKPLFGHSGFGNVFNNYCWTMGVYGDRLYTGTMDCSYLIFGSLGLEYAGFDYRCFESLGFQGIRFGSDLYAFPSAGEKANAVSLNGMGNPTNYGIRTMEPSSCLYLGTANPMNLHPKGGWELIALTAY